MLTQECDVTVDNDAAVLSCDLSPDGSRLITGDTEGSVKVWSLPRGQLLQDYPAHTDFVYCVQYSPRSKFMLSAADNGIIKVCLNECTEIFIYLLQKHEALIMICKL